MAAKATMPRAPREQDVDEDGIGTNGTEAAEDASDGRIEIGATAVKDMPTAEWALYRRVSTILNKAGVTEEQLRGMRYRERRAISGLGGQGLELLEETLDMDDPARMALLFQEPGRRTSARKYGPSPFPNVPPHIASRIVAAGIEDADALSTQSDEQLRSIKGLGKSAIVKIRESYGPPPLSEVELADIEASPGRVKKAQVVAMVTELLRYREGEREQGGDTA